MEATEKQHQKDEAGTIENDAPPTIENDGRTRITFNNNHLSTATELVAELWSPMGKAQNTKAVVSVIKTTLENGCSQSELASALTGLNAKGSYISAYPLQRELNPQPSMKGELMADKEVDWSNESEDL